MTYHKGHQDLHEVHKEVETLIPSWLLRALCGMRPRGTKWEHLVYSVVTPTK